MVEGELFYCDMAREHETFGQSHLLTGEKTDQLNVLFWLLQQRKAGCKCTCSACGLQYDMSWLGKCYGWPVHIARA